MNLLRLFRRIDDGRDKKNQSKHKPSVWEFPQIKKRDSDGYYPIVCPHCMSHFHIWEVEFRSPMPYLENGQDHIVNNIEGFPGEIDTRYDDFEMFIGSAVWERLRGKVLKIFDEKGEPTGEVTHITLMDKQNGGADKNGTLIPIMERNARDFTKKPIRYVINKYGQLCTDRICPYCHHQVSNYVGIMPSYNIALIGDIRVGKAAYLNRLEQSLLYGGLLGGSLIGHNSDPNYKSWIRSEMELDQTTKEDQPKYPNQMIDYIMPNTIIFHKNQEQEGFILNLFNFEGSVIERLDCNDNRKMLISQIYGRMIDKMDAFMLMFDAAHFETVRAVFESDEVLKSYINNNSRVQHPLELLTFFESEYLREQEGIFTKPVAFIMSKSDLIRLAKYKNSDYFQNLTDSETFLDTNLKHERDKTKVDLDDLYACERAIERFLQESHKDSLLFRRAKDDQRNGESLWFAVSSLGDAQDGLADPVRITEPIEWILWRLGLVQGEGDAIPGGGNPIRVK